MTSAGKGHGNHAAPVGVLSDMLPFPSAMRRPTLLVAIVTLLLAACAAGTGQPPESADEPSAEASATDRPMRSDVPAQPVPSASAPTVVGEVPEELLGQILTNAAEHADVEVDAIDVVRAEAVTWNDGSLGCPEPGMMYTQALVDGYHVVLDADGTELDYRATTNGDFRLCENGGAPSGG